MNLEKIKMNIDKQLKLKDSSPDMVCENDLTHKDLATAIEMCPTILSRKLNGRRKIILEDVLDILGYFECKFEEIFR